MSGTEGEPETQKFVFKARYGATATGPDRSEASHEEVDAFVRSILGVDKNKKT
jgi:hypothetical protein